MMNNDDAAAAAAAVPMMIKNICISLSLDCSKCFTKKDTKKIFTITTLNIPRPTSNIITSVSVVQFVVVFVDNKKI